MQLNSDLVGPESEGRLKVVGGTAHRVEPICAHIPMGFTVPCVQDFAT